MTTRRSLALAVLAGAALAAGAAAPALAGEAPPPSLDGRSTVTPPAPASP